MVGYCSKYLSISGRSLAALVSTLLILSAVVFYSAFAGVSTDKPDYAPGETVTISGDGFDGRERIEITVSAPYGTESGSTKADRVGAFTWSFVLPNDSSAHGWYSYTAHGLKSDIMQASTFTDHGAGTPDNCITQNNNTTSFQVEEDDLPDHDNTPNGSTYSGAEIVANAVGTNIITAICIKSGGGNDGAFAVEDPDGTPDSGDENSGKTSTDTTSGHSVLITADGIYGLDLDLTDSIDGCYEVTGLGTGTVTVTKVSDACKDLSHLDVFTRFDDSSGGGDEDFFKSTDCPDVFGIYSNEAVECSIFITFTDEDGTDVDLLIVDAIPAEFDVDYIDLSAANGTIAESSPQGHGGNTSTRIEWFIPQGTSGTVTLQVDISTVESPGGGHKNTVFKPTSCGPLPLNEGAIAYEFIPGPEGNEIDQGEIVKDDQGDAVIVTGPTNQLVAEAGEGTKPCAPELLSVETTGTLGQLKLTWSDPDDEEIVQYNIYRNTTSGGRYKNGQFVTSVNGDTFMFTDTGLADGTQYCYVVKAEYADGNESNESNEICATTLVPVE